MTDIHAAERNPAVVTLSARFGVPLAIGGALALGLLLTMGRAADVWRTGMFGDTDDAVRMVEVRNLLAGQSWYDMTIARMDPPAGVFMHWSRTIDVPLALLMKFFALFAEPEAAEGLTRLAFPLLLLAALYVAVAWVCRTLGGKGDKLAEQLAGVALAFATGSVFSQFVPGRIDHHAPQIVLLVLMTGASLAAFDSSHAKLAALSGALAALSLSISVENLPFIVVLAAAHPLAWILRGQEQRAALQAYALGLSLGLVFCFFVTIGPQRWLVAACDAYSIAHASAGLAGAAALLALAALSSKLQSLTARVGATIVLGAAPLVALALVAPQCMGDPFVGLDPLVRSIWLDHVSEVRKLLDLAREQPSTAATISIPVALSLLATIVCAALARGLKRAQMALLAALIAAGLAMTFWGVRVFSSAAPLAACGAAIAAVDLARRSALPTVSRAALATLLCVICAPFSYALFLPSDPPASDGDTKSCLRPEALRPLGALPAGIILAPIDSGSHLLALTHHSVFGAPYHRNNRGDRLAIDAFSATPVDAERIVRASGAAYVVLCPAQMQAHVMAERAPQGLAAALMAGNGPSWLERIDVGATPNQAYRLRP